MSRKPSPQRTSPKQPFIAGFLIPVFLLATLTPTLLFQDTTPGDPVIPIESIPVETPAQREVRMLAAFDNPSAVPGALIVSFEPGTSLNQANTILGGANFHIQTSQNCTTPQEVGPGQTTVNGTPTCFNEGWYESISAGLVLVPSGEEKNAARTLISLSGVVWVEPNYTVTLDESGNAPVPTLYENIPSDTSSNILGIEPIWLVVGVLAVGFGAFFAMKK